MVEILPLLGEGLGGAVLKKPQVGVLLASTDISRITFVS
jgi:hypothetical protein